MSAPKRVADRIASGMKRLVPIVLQQKTRDVSEADTVTLVKDLLSEVFGYDKYSDLTGEYAVRGTYCDLAIKIDDKAAVLMEVKAIGIGLTDRHVQQALNYAANEGIEWVILTNAVVWRLYHVIFSKPIDKQLVYELDITACDPRKASDMEMLFTFTKEGFRKGSFVELRDRQDATSRFLLAAVLLNNEAVLTVMRREIRRIVDLTVSEDEVVKVLKNEVIKRDAIEGPEAEAAVQRVRKGEKRIIIRQDSGKDDAESRSDASTGEKDAPAQAPSIHPAVSGGASGGLESPPVR